ncbi:MAG: hypothetical protein WCE21_04230 [Candidatus Babeliales bacterium]
MQHIVRFVLISMIITSPLHAATWQFVNNSAQAVDIVVHFGSTHSPQYIKNLKHGESDSATVVGAALSKESGKQYDQFEIQIKPTSAADYSKYGFRFAKNADYSRPVPNAGSSDATVFILSLAKSTNKTEAANMFQFGYTQGASQATPADTATASDDSPQ